MLRFLAASKTLQCHFIIFQIILDFEPHVILILDLSQTFKIRNIFFRVFLSLTGYNRDQIDAVVVNGRLRLVAGQPIDWDGEDLRHDAMKAAATITSAPDIVRRHGPSNLYRPKIS